MRAPLLRLTLLAMLSLSLSREFRAQGPPAAIPVTAPAGSFAAEPYVVLHQSMVFSFKVDGTGYREQTASVKIQSDAALRQLGVLAVAFASASEHVELHYVRVRRPDGTVLETNVDGAIEEPAPVTREAPFYSDLKQKELPVKSLEVGDTLEWQVRIIRTAAEAPGEFWGQETFIHQGVVLSEDFELHVPAALTVNVWTNAKDGPPPTSTIEGTERVYHWTHNNLKPTVGPQADAAKKAEETHVLTPEEETDATDGKLPSLAWTTFPDWAAVGSWYRKLEAARMVPDDAVKAKVAELTAGKTTDEDKALAIYTYVSTQIRYIGVAFGIGRYQPHAASDVLANQYGDCKDKHTLLAAMLSAAGISSDAVLIGEGIRFNQAVPSPEAFNHLITQAQVNGHDVWLDSTAEVAPFRVLVPTLRDKPALVVPSSGPATVQQTPAALPFAPFSTATVSGSVDKDLNSDSEIVLTYRNDEELVLRGLLRQFSVAQYEQFVQSLMSSLGFGGTTSQASIAGVADTSQPLVFSFHYQRIHEPDWGADRITAIFTPISLPAVDQKKPPVASLQLGVPRTQTNTVDFKLPEHFSAELPEAVHAHAPFANCDVTYRLSQGTLHAERVLVVLKDKVPATDWKAYQKWYDDCGVDGVPYLRLVRSGDTLGRDATPVVSNTQAAKLIEDANDAVRDGQTDKARDLLDQAKALNPEQRGLWGTYGYRAYELGMTTEAIDDYRREVLYHPDQTWAYGPLATELYRAGRKDEAITTLRSGISADPANLQMNTALVSLLALQGDRAGAIAAGTAAIKLLPADDTDNLPLLLAVATAQVDTQAFADADALLTKALKVAETPGDKNNAAYLLSETGLDLPVAEAAEHSAIDSLTEETRAWTLDESPEKLKQTSSLLVAAWDTMGWILYREGRIPEARNYVEAAWHDHQSTEVGLHLGDILLAQNDPNAALATYQLAQATLPASTSFHNGKLTSSSINSGARPLADKIEAGIARARKAGAKSSTRDTHAELQQMRVLPVGEANGHSGSVEYRVLISQGKVDAIRPAGPTTLTGAEALFQKASFSALTPAKDAAKIAVFGYLNCLSATCEFVVEP